MDWNEVSYLLTDIAQKRQHQIERFTQIELELFELQYKCERSGGGKKRHIPNAAKLRIRQLKKARSKCNHILADTERYYEKNREYDRQRGQTEHRQAWLKEYKKRYRLQNPEKLNAYARAYYVANKEKILAQQRKRYEANKEEILEKHREHQKEYRAAHRDEINAQQRERMRGYYQKHKEEIKAKNKAYREAHREKYRENQRRYRAAKKQQQGENL